MYKDPSDDEPDEDDDDLDEPDPELDFWTKLRLEIVERACVHEVEGKPLYDFQGYGCLSSFEGGMGLVIIAHDYELDRKVAIKLLKSTGSAAEAALLAEAKKLARLSHPNVVTVHHVGKCEADSSCEDSVYMVMEYVEGTDGREWLRTCPSWEQIRDVFVDAAMGLAAAHDAGIQHRDFKPANMLVGKDGRTRVADFGVADMLREFADDDEPNHEVPGTPAYIAPERLRGERGDGRSDQFSFSVSLQRALHGRPFLDGLESVTSLRSEALGVPRWLTRVVHRGLAPNPDDRYADMHELVRALKGEAADEPDVRVLQAPTSGPSAADERVRLAMVTSIVAVLAMTLVSVLLVVVVLRSPVMMAPPSHAEPSPATPSNVPPEDEATVDQVLELVEAGRLTEATAKWLPEYQRRQWLGEPVHEETARIGEACLGLARKRKDEGRVEDARSAARRAKTFAKHAAADFDKYARLPDSETGPDDGRVAGSDSGSELVTRVEQFMRELDSPADSTSAD